MQDKQFSFENLKRDVHAVRMLRLRTHAWICFAFFAALLVFGWGGAALEASGVAPPSPAWRWPILALLFALVLGFAFSAVPVMVLLVTGAQKRISSPAAGLATPRWQNAIVYVLWGLMAAGAAIAIPAAILLGAFEEIGVDPGASRGTLVARPGMTIAEVKRASLGTSTHKVSRAEAEAADARALRIRSAGHALIDPRRERVERFGKDLRVLASGLCRDVEGMIGVGERMQRRVPAQP
jgi:hypothetical protein